MLKDPNKVFLHMLRRGTYFAMLCECLPVDVSVFMTGTVSRSRSLKTRALDQIQLLLLSVSVFTSSSPLSYLLLNFLSVYMQRGLKVGLFFLSSFLISEWLFVCPPSALVTETVHAVVNTHTFTLFCMIWYRVYPKDWVECLPFKISFKTGNKQCFKILIN